MKLRLLALVLLAAGCSTNIEPSLKDVNNTNIKKLRGAYGLFLFQHNLRGPESEEELKEYLSSDAGAAVKLGRMGVSVDQIDSMFVSERDNQPFKVRYGLRGLGDHPIVFEAEGVDGKRFIAFTTPREVDAAEYESLWDQKASASSAQAF